MQGKQILVIDDDPHVLRMVRLILSNEGAQIHTAANGMEGLTQFSMPTGPIWSSWM
jgi:CheY-like chemotaxis protein